MVSAVQSNGKSAQPATLQALKAKLLRIVVGVGLLALPAVGLTFWLAQDNPFAWIVGKKVYKMGERYADVPGITDAAFVSAADAKLDGNALVIGVVFGGEAKAYVRNVFGGGPAGHILHDHFGEAEVTVTHCDRTRCTRVFTSTGELSLSQMHCGGWLEEQQMALLVGDKRFAHSSKEIPFAEVPFVVTTWKKWRSEHPASLVYVGEREKSEPSPKSTPVSFNVTAAATLIP